MKKSSLVLALTAGALVALLAGCGGTTDTVEPLATLDSAPPAAPSGLATVIDGNRHRALTWAPNSEADLGSYQVYQYSPSPTRSESYVLVATVTASSNQWTLPNVDDVSTTYYKLRAVDQGGNRSAESAPRLVMLMPDDLGLEPGAFEDTPKRR